MTPKLLRAIVRAFADKFGRVRAEHAVAGFDEKDLRVGRIDVAKFVLQAVAGDLGHGAGHLDAGRPAADDHEREQHAAALGDRFRARPARTR